jgi:WD40 repeat protein
MHRFCISQREHHSGNPRWRGGGIGMRSFSHVPIPPPRCPPHRLSPCCHSLTLRNSDLACFLARDRKTEHSEDDTMAQRHLLIAHPSRQRKRTLTHLHMSVDDQTPIGPWITTLAGRLNYPLVDSFGAPIPYRLRSLVTSNRLPTTGHFSDTHFPSGDSFVLEPDLHDTAPTPPRYRGSAASSPPVSRRVLMRGGILAITSLFGAGSGMTSAFAQYLLSHPRTVMTHPSPAPLTISPLTIFTHHQQTVRSVTWAPDESMLASSGDDARVFIWQRDGSLLHTLPFTAPVRAVGWSPDGQQIVTADATTVSFFQAQTGSLLAEDAGHHTAPITALGWTETSTPLALSAGLDTTAIVWNGQSHQPQVIFRQHTTAIEALALLADTVATASQGGVTRVWNALSGQEIHGYYADSTLAARTVAFSATGLLAVGGDDDHISLWNHGLTCIRQTQDRFGLHCLDAPSRLQVQAQPIRAIAFSPDGTLLATGDETRLLLWSMHTLAPIVISPQQEAMTALAWSFPGGGNWRACAPLGRSSRKKAGSVWTSKTLALFSRLSYVHRSTLSVRQSVKRAERFCKDRTLLYHPSQPGKGFAHASCFFQ